MIGYIYKTTNIINNKIYIGQHKSQSFDTNYKGSGSYLWNAINKYGWDNFITEILVTCNSKDEMNSEEIRLIEEYDSTNPLIGYNLTKGGDGGQLGYYPTEDTRKKLSESSKGNKYFEGHTHTDEWKRMMSERMKNRKFSDETRMKMSNSAKLRDTSKARKASADSRRGKPLSESTKKKLSEINTGKVLSDATKKKISEANTGRHFTLSDEAKHKISVSNSNRLITDSMRNNMSKGKSKYIYTYLGVDYYGWKSIVEFIRSTKYPKFSQSSLNKIVSGGVVKGYEDLSNTISVRLVGDTDEN